jgi:beta-glucosidase
MMLLFGVVVWGGATAGGGDDGDDGPRAIHPALWPSVQSPVPHDPELERRVADLLDRMTVEEKVGQIIQAEIRYVTPEDVRKYRLGSVLNGGGVQPGNAARAAPEDWLALADAFWEASMDTFGGGQAVPVLWGTDAVHGHNNVVGATVFPHNIGLGATRSPELIRKIGEVTASEVAVTGLDWTFAPTLAVVRDDRWGRTYEGYSEDPEIVRAYAGEMVRGLQGAIGESSFLDGRHVVATAKHFLGDGGTLGGKDTGDNLSTEEELRDVHGAGYVTALEAGVQTVMASFSSWHGVKMHANSALLSGVLKGQMGFDGFIVGDWNAHGHLTGCSNTSCPTAFNAGIDMFMVPEDWRALYADTVAQVAAGAISMDRLDDAVRRILRVKMRAGLFDRVRPSSRPLAGRFELLGSVDHRSVARQAVRESLVLLKNNGGLLPLDRAQTVLVAGDGAHNIGKQCGGWSMSWQGDDVVNADFPGATSIWDGIRTAVEEGGGKAILSEAGNFEVKPDVAIVVFGEEPYAETPGDRDTLEYGRLSPNDLELLNRLGNAGIPVVSIFITGRPMWVNPELNASDAFVAAWLPGSEGGGVADVVFRAADGAIHHDFSGKLSYSWPRTAVQTAQNRGDVGYDPLFPYGFGLTYGDRWDLRELPEASGVEGWAAGREVFAKDSILQTMERVADWQLERLVYEAPLPDGGTQEVTDTEWVRGAFFAGVMAAHRATGNDEYLNAALELGEKNRWQPGPRPRHADDHCIAQTYSELFMTRRDPRMIAPMVGRLDAMVAEPRPAAAGGWSADDNWSWCDALFMAPPTMAMVAEATGERAYLDLMNSMWWETYDYLYDQEEHLWYRDGNFTVQPDGTQPRAPNGEKIFWGRGNGWVLAGLARVMEHMPADYPDRPRYEVLMREMAARLIQVQGADGLWRSSLLDPEQYPAPEASCTGFFTYGLAWGVNHGILDRATYLPAVERAWRGLVWAVQPSGKLGWVQQIGYDPRSVSSDDSMEYGAGAFLLAASEIATIDWAGWWFRSSESATKRPQPVR